jgi:hypothetical protein
VQGCFPITVPGSHRLLPVEWLRQGHSYSVCRASHLLFFAFLFTLALVFSFTLLLLFLFVFFAFLPLFVFLVFLAGFPVTVIRGLSYSGGRKQAAAIILAARASLNPGIAAIFSMDARASALTLLMRYSASVSTAAGPMPLMSMMAGFICFSPYFYL